MSPVGDLLIELAVDVGHRHFRFRLGRGILLRVEADVALQQEDPAVDVLDGEADRDVRFRGLHVDLKKKCFQLILQGFFNIFLVVA